MPLSGQPVECVGPAMGTLVRVLIYSERVSEAQKACQGALQRVQQLDSILSDYLPTSELNRLTAAAPGKRLRISEDLYRVLEMGQRLAGETNGRFDITLGPLTRIWREKRAPTPAERERIRGITGYSRLQLEPGKRAAMVAVAGMQLDLGALGKGYAAGEALRQLRSQGFGQSMVAVSGDIAVGDAPPGREAWRIASPVVPEPLALVNASISTSGDTEQFFENGGVRFSHLIDAGAGTGLERSPPVTVVSREGVEADGLATALSLIPASQRDALLRAHPKAKAWFQKH